MKTLIKNYQIKRTQDDAKCPQRKREQFYWWPVHLAADVLCPDISNYYVAADKTELCCGVCIMATEETELWEGFEDKAFPYILVSA